MIKRPGFGILKLLIIVFLFTGCSLIQKMGKSKAEKSMEQHSKGQILTYEKAKKEHMDRQNERTLKMMKKSKKRSKKLNRIHRESWIKRFLGL